MRRTLPQLSTALAELSLCVEDGLACADAAERLMRIHEALTVVGPFLSRAAGRMSRHSDDGQAFRAAANILIGEVLE